MRNRLLKVLGLFAISFGLSYSATAQIYVHIRPTAPVIVRPPQPSHLHVWINDEWEPAGTSYRYSGGHWDLPPHDGYRYNNGHWRHHGNDGDEWVRGNWGERSHGNGHGNGHGNRHGKGHGKKK